MTAREHNRRVKRAIAELKAMANRVDVSDALAATYLLDASDRVLEARAKARTG